MIYVISFFIRENFFFKILISMLLFEKEFSREFLGILQKLGQSQVGKRMFQQSQD